MAEWWVTNWGNVIGVVGTVLTAIGLYLSFKGWKLKRPTYVICSNNIFAGLEHTIPEVEVKFPGYGSPVKALTVTKIAFWNAGTETINRQDVVKDNPLSLRAKAGVAILSVSVLERTLPFNKLECGLNRERTEATITFDYLDHNDGALIQIFYSGTANDDIQLEGTIKGSRPIQRRSLTPPSKKQKQLSRWTAIPFVCSIWVLFTMLGYILVHPPQFQPKTGGITLSDSITIGLLTFLGLFISGAVAYSLYVTAVPKRLSKIHWGDP
jgi:hypothetical protein